MDSRRGNIYFLGISIIIAFFILGYFFYISRQDSQTIKVVGMSKQLYTSDIIKWTVSIENFAYSYNLSDGYKKIIKKRKQFITYLVSKGINKDDISFKPITSYQIYNNGKPTDKYRFTQTIIVVSNKVKLIEKIALEDMIDSGFLLRSSYFEYYYSKIDSLKKELLSSATENAKQRALKMLEGTGLNIDRIKSIRAGVFQITEPYSNEVSSYGVYNTRVKKKEIKVTVHVLYTLK